MISRREALQDYLLQLQVQLELVTDRLVPSRYRPARRIGLLDEVACSCTDLCHLYIIMPDVAIINYHDNELRKAPDQEKDVTIRSRAFCKCAAASS